jgi:hypothetical protein
MITDERFELCPQKDLYPNESLQSFLKERNE